MTAGRENAETVALQALAWLAGHDDLWPLFLGSTGLAPGDVAARAREAEFLASVLDFLMMDDSWVVGFCDSARLPYDRPRAARAALPGGATPDWT